jgi:hypothetical protein
VVRVGVVLQLGIHSRFLEIPRPLREWKAAFHIRASFAGSNGDAFGSNRKGSIGASSRGVEGLFPAVVPP